MTGCLSVWWWKGLRARVRAQRSRICLLAAVVAPLLCLSLASPDANANPDRQRDEEDHDGQSRFEFPGAMDYVKVYFGEDRLPEEYRSMVLIRARLVETVRTEDLGVEFENLDRLDVSGIPLVGGLFDERLSAADFTEKNRVGTAYSNGIGGLVMILGDGATSADDVSISVVNGKGRFHLRHGAVRIDIAAVGLGELGKLQSVRQLLSGEADRETEMVLGGLTQTSVPDAGTGLPVLGDVPLLQSLFRGTVHQRDETELLVLIKPSIILQEEDN